MIYIPRWKILLTITVSLLSILYCVPTLLDKSSQDWLKSNLPSWLPTQSIRLGLDLQGGSHLLLEADIDAVVRQRMDDMVTSLRTELRKQGINYTSIGGTAKGIKVTLSSPDKIGEAQKIVRRLDEGLIVSASGNTIEGIMDERFLKETRDQTISRSIEIVNRRINATGVEEPIIQRQGESRVLVQLPGVEDPERVKQLIGKTAKLTFHLVDIDGAGGVDSRSLPMHEDRTQTLPIKRRVIMTGDMLVNAQPAFQDGMPVVSFRLNSVGAKRFCDVTRENVDKPFAVVLDNEIITAPRINEPICGGSAQISGRFTVQEAADLALLLRAGALPTTLTVVEERSVGPTLGSDSIKAGTIASVVAFGLIMALMLVCYGLFGMFSSIALFINMTLTLAVMTMIGATLTLPGIAGLVLTIGTAVDANVLIFERIKEEIRAGRSIIAAIDAGYQRAMTSIIDSNLTSLIAGLILFTVGTGPIKGFAVTMSIGILTSLFSAIMLTRVMMIVWLRNTKAKTLPIMS
jgi:preprotein translocase subunit SecD